MATGNVRGLVNDLENMCECSICYIEYDEQKKVPRMLPCQHTFCTQCLSKQCKGQKLKCFLCSKEHHVENKDINIFPKDNTRRNLRDLLEKYWQSTCGVCRRHDQVKYFCATCNIRMCRGCYKERKSSGCCHTHDVHIPEDSSLTPDTSLDLNDMQSKNVCLLSGHENNELKYFCCEKSCCKAICANCVIESHKEHAYMTVKDEYENRKKYMLNKCQAITDKIVKASLLLKNVEKECETLKKGDSLGRKSLSAEAELGILYIKDFEENAKKKTSETLQKNLSTLEKKKEELRCFIENAKECCAVSEEALNGNNFISFFSVEKTLTDKLNCFEESKVDKPLEPMPETDFELQNAILELRQRINQMRRDKHENEEQNWFQRFKSKFWNSRRKQKKRPWYCSLLSWFRLLVLVVLLALNMAPDTPYASVFQINRADVAFPNGKSSLMCYAVDTKTISTMPIENMLQTCGNPQNMFIYRGAFTNTSFLYRNESLLFSIHVFEVKKYSPGLILFEFGVSKASIERKHIHGLQSADFYGWFLKILDSDGKVALINTEGQTVQTRVISDHNKAAFPFIIKLNSNRRITLKTIMKGTKAYKILDETKLIKGKPKLGFAKVCDSSDASVSIEIFNDDVAFNATTLYPNVYISNDNKSLSNTQFQNFSKKEIKNGSIYQDVEILNCGNECVYVIDFRVFSPHSINSFTLVLTNSKFLPSAYRNVSILSYEKCTVRNFFKFQSYCLKVDKNLQSGMYSAVEMKPNLWHRLTIMIHRKSQKASFFFGNIKIELQNGSIIGSGTPILRWVMQNANVNVEIKFSKNDDFSILTWFYYKMTPFINCLTSILPFSPGFSGWLIRTIVLLSFVSEWFAYFANYIYDKYFGQDRVYVAKPIKIIRGPRRGIRHRSR